MDDSKVREFVSAYSKQCGFIEENVPIDKKFVHKSDSSQVIISDIKDATEYANLNSENEAIYYCKVLPNLNCPVCFDHPLDHVPMMILFEAFRQMSLAVSHTHRGIELCGFNSMVDTIYLQHMLFSELDKGLYLFCFDKLTKNKSNMQVRELHFYYVQSGVITTTVSGNIINAQAKIYNKLREKSRLQIFKDKEKLYPILTSDDIRKRQ